MTSTSPKDKPVDHSCASCNRNTWHDILYSHWEEVEGYNAEILHQIVRCCGCHTISFRKVTRDFESAYPIDDDDWYVPQQIYCYPSILKGHQELRDVWDLPESVRSIYIESVQAIKDGSNILAGIGLRATIEAICNDQSITGKTLDKRIDALAKGGLISEKDSERLHAIRFLGNDAAHEIKNASQKHLLIALRIIEHLLVNIYILDGEADSALDTIIKTPDRFIKLLDGNLKDFNAGDEIPLAKIFGREMRRFHGHFQVHEKYLMDQIAAGTYKKLSVGKLDFYAGSKEKLQHFKII